MMIPDLALHKGPVYGRSVRVLTGPGRAQRLRGPGNSGEVRPTSSLVKSAIFNMIPPELIEGGRVMDAYAGTGALGIEALSRGARWADFIERDRAMCQRVRESLEAFGFAETSHVYCATVKKGIEFLSEPYDLVLMDPPYAESGTDEIMAQMANAGLLKEKSLLVLEHSSRVAPVERAGAMALSRTRRYGDTAVSFYHLESGS